MSPTQNFWFFLNREILMFQTEQFLKSEKNRTKFRLSLILFLTTVILICAQSSNLH